MRAPTGHYRLPTGRLISAIDGFQESTRHNVAQILMLAAKIDMLVLPRAIGNRQNFHRRRQTTRWLAQSRVRSAD